MVRQRSSEQAGENRNAVEAIVADLKHRELLRVADGPLVEVARSLASAVDADPSSSQHVMQYRAAVDQLRREVQQIEADADRQLTWFIETGCQERGHGSTADCTECCALADGLAAVEAFEPHPRSWYEARANGLPLGELSDADYAKASILEFLRRFPRVPLADSNGGRKGQQRGVFG